MTVLDAERPWRVVETDTRIAIKAGRRTVAYVQIDKEDSERAALIAAAPDLLELAKAYAGECYECAGAGITPENEGCENCRHIRAVIARAEGQ
jgi:hypothetical protein